MEKLCCLNLPQWKKRGSLLCFQNRKRRMVERLGQADARALFHEFSGCLDGDINEQAEMLGALDEKFENTN